MAAKPRPRTTSVFERGKEVLVGGVNSPVRAFRAVGGTPLVIEKAFGSRLTDVDGNEYIDYVCSWGAQILGHSHPDIVAAVQQEAIKGTSYGMTSPLEVELALQIRRAVPSMQRVRFVNSGTEATMSAVRAARGFTKRDLILKFDGAYHGHADQFLVDAGSGLATLGIHSSPGVPASLAKLTLTAPYNDLDSVAAIFREHAGKIAAIIVEPIAANMGVAPPLGPFLTGLREITEADKSLLIFDEVITGFRIDRGGAQGLFGIQPDLTTLGKIIGGGLPVAAYGGRSDIMELVAPVGPVYQAGTLSGNPLAMRAGLAMLGKLEAPGFYEELNSKAERLAEGLRAALRDSMIPGQVNVAGSLLTLFFTASPVRDYTDAKKSDTTRFAAFFTEMLSRGILLPPSQFEALFVSAAHTDADIEQTLEAARQSLLAMRGAFAARAD
ncbi:MAG TPA: glutamate-1-semialdehyde 2,1-aminomutase [Candidatus Acidoferrum sp.]|nr:glutamate-1-semialdehyde 2,1-aminomutase [Candidatus Acidoferrum sp.]